MARTPDPNKPKRLPTGLVAALVYKSDSGKSTIVCVSHRSIFTPGWAHTGEILTRDFGESSAEFRLRVQRRFAELNPAKVADAAAPQSAKPVKK